MVNKSRYKLSHTEVHKLHVSYFVRVKCLLVLNRSFKDNKNLQITMLFIMRNVMLVKSSIGVIDSIMIVSL